MLRAVRTNVWSRASSQARAQTSLISSSSGRIRPATSSNGRLVKPANKQLHSFQTIRAFSDSVWGRKDEEMSPRQLITEIRNRKDHSFTLKAISRGWADQSLPHDDIFLKEYIKAAIATNRFDSMDVTGLISEFRSNGNSHQGGMGGPMLSGGSEHNPLHVVNTLPKGYWMSYMIKVALTVTLFAGIYYYLNTEEKPGTSGSAGGGGGIAGRLTGNMKSNIHIAENPDKSFKDVVGVEEAKAELQEIVMYLKEPQRFTRLGGKLPKGVLLTGPPGTGKTLLAKAIAGEAGVPFFYTSGSEFEEMFVGVGARRVRDMFEAAKAKAPCIIFIDEVDAIGGSRHLKDQSTMKMTLNQLLVEMDGFETNNGVVVIAATNFPDSLDNALTRPGRLDKHVDVPLPDIGGRTAILKLYGSKVPLGNDVDLEQLSRGTPGFSGADLYNLMNQAALKSSVEGLKHISMASLEFAKDKIMMGAERQSAIISEETIKCTAYHEAGHAVVAHLTPGAEPIHKATVMPRGRALGMVMQLPEGDQTSMTRRQMLARMDVCMGGRVAEELIFGPDEITSGASSDIQQATRLANAMVTKFGMSEKVGMRYIEGGKDGQSGGGKDVDEEVKKLLDSSYQRAFAMLSEHKDKLEVVAKGLIEYESLSGAEVVDLINGRKISEHHEKRSQKPSRDIVPIKNRQRPAAALKSAGGSGDNGSGSGASTPPAPRRPVRRPVAPNNASASAASEPVSPPSAPAADRVEAVRRRSWGSVDEPPKPAVRTDKAAAVEAAVEAPPAASPPPQTGWGSTVKGWFGYGSAAKEDTSAEPSVHAEVDTQPAVASKPAAHSAQEHSSAPAVAPARTLPSSVGPPVERISAAAKKSVSSPPKPSGQSSETAVGHKTPIAETPPSAAPSTTGVTTSSNAKDTRTLQEAIARKASKDSKPTAANANNEGDKKD